MRCRECGLEVDNEKAFCPVCGAPMKVTADYDYIQAEIANKVDRYFNEDQESPSEDAAGSDTDMMDYPQDDMDTGDGDDMAKTRDVYGSDSIFDDDEEPEDLDFDDLDPEDVPIEKDVEEEYSAHDRRVYDRPVQGQAQRRRPSNAARSRQRRRKRKNQTAAKVITFLVILAIIAGATLGVLGIVGFFNKDKGKDGQGQSKASLTSNIEAGSTYTSPVNVVLSNKLEGNIFYTLDGSEPSANSRMYTEPFDITGKDVPGTYPDVHLRAVSFSPDSEKSGELNIVFSLEYDENDAPAPVPTEPETEAPTQPAITELSVPDITPEDGFYTEDTAIKVSSAEGADIYYTWDGTVPTAASERYKGSVDMRPGTHTFTAVAIMNDIVSEPAVREYSLDYGYPVSADGAVMNASLWLFANGYTIDYDFNTTEGYAQAVNLGVEDIGAYTYYVIQVDFYTQDGTKTGTEYVGIGVNYGGGEHLVKDGDTYSYN